MKTTKTSKMVTGTELEAKTEALLRLIPGAKVYRESLVVGKKVDLICHLDLSLNFRIRAAVECKAYDRALGRKQVAGILVEYDSVVESSEIDCLFIITKKGLSAAAAELIDRRRVHHYRVDELSVLAMGTGNLVYNMIEQFEMDGLSDDFIAPEFQVAEGRLLARYSQQIEYGPLWAAMEHHKRNRWVDLLSVQEPGKRHSTPTLPLLWDLVKAWIDDPLTDEHLAVLGSYGIGKSSFSRYVANRQALSHQENPEERIPLLLRLRDFSSHTSMDSFVSSELATVHNVTNPSFIRFTALNRMGRFLVILDGFDEMKAKSSFFELKLCFEELSKLAVPGSKVLLLGRPTLFSDEEEMDQVLSGRFDTVSGRKVAQHLMVRLSPLRRDQIGCMLAKRGQRVLKLGQPGYSQYQDIQSLLLSSAKGEQVELESLLSRPVHVQMLLQVLPSWEGDVSKIDRLKLYERFVFLSIQRELQRIPASVESKLSADDRMQFSGKLALEMLKRGGSMSIRFREVPDRIVFDFFSAPFDSLEAVRRDLLLASFLEFSGGEVLYFAHKSYGEYFAAREIVRLLKKPEWAEFPDIERFPPEVSAFVKEMLAPEDVVYFDNYITSNDIGLSHEVLSWIGDCLALSVLKEYWFGRLAQGGSPLAPYMLPIYSHGEPRSQLFSLVRSGISKGTPAFHQQCWLALAGLWLRTRHSASFLELFLLYSKDSSLETCLNWISKHQTLKPSRLLSALTLRIKRSFEKESWSVLLEGIGAIESLLASGYLTPADVVSSADLISELKRFKKCGPEDIVAVASDWLLGAFTGRLRKSVELQDLPKALEVVKSIESLIDSEYLSSLEIARSSPLIKELEELRNKGQNDVVTAVTGLLTKVS